MMLGMTGSLCSFLGWVEAYSGAYCSAFLMKTFLQESRAVADVTRPSSLLFSIQDHPGSSEEENKTGASAMESI